MSESIRASFRLLSRLRNSFKNIVTLLTAHQTYILLGARLKGSRLRHYHRHPLCFIHEMIILIFYLSHIEIRRILERLGAVPVILLHFHVRNIFVIHIIKAELIIWIIVWKIEMKCTLLIAILKFQLLLNIEVILLF